MIPLGCIYGRIKKKSKKKSFIIVVCLLMVNNIFNHRMQTHCSIYVLTAPIERSFSSPNIYTHHTSKNVVCVSWQGHATSLEPKNTP